MSLFKPSRELIALLFVTSVAWVLRACIALRFASEPVWDAHYYDYYARRIAEGFGYSDGGGAVPHPAAHYPVGYSGFLSVFYYVFGDSHGVGIAVNVAIGAALAGITFLLVRTYASRRIAFTAGLLVAVHPGLLLYSTLVMSEQLSALLAMLSLYLAVRARVAVRRLWGWRAAAFLVLGFGTLVRPQTLLLFPALLPWPATWQARDLLQCARIPLLGVALTLLPVLPWTARNCAQMDGCALVSTNGGWNLAIGSFPRATGRFETLHGEDGCSVVTGQVQQDRCWGERGVAWIKSDTRRWLGLIPEKLHQTFDHESFAVNYLKQGRPDLWTEERANLTRARLSSLHVALMVFATIGLLIAALRTRLRSAGRAFPSALWGLLAYLGGVIFTHAMFFGEDRYHMVLVPAFCIFATEVSGLRSLSSAPTSDAIASSRRAP